MSQERIIQYSNVNTIKYDQIRSNMMSQIKMKMMRPVPIAIIWACHCSTLTIRLLIRQSTGHNPSHFPSVPSSTLHSRHTPLSRQNPCSHSTHAPSPTATQFDGNSTHAHRLLPATSVRLHPLAHSLQVYLSVQLRQFAWHWKQVSLDPRKQPELHSAHKLADPALATRQLVAVELAHVPPLKYNPGRHREQALAGQSEHWATEQGWQTTPTRQQPGSQAVQVHTLARTVAVAESQPVKVAQRVQAPAWRQQPSQQEEQLPQMSLIFLQLLVLCTQEMPTKQQRSVSTTAESSRHWVGVFSSLQRAAPSMQSEHSRQTPLSASRKYRSAHSEHSMKLLASAQVVQPVEPPQVLSTQEMHRLDTRMQSSAQEVQVDPSTQTSQLEGHPRQWSEKKQNSSRQELQVESSEQVAHPSGQTEHKPPSRTFQQQPGAQVRQESEPMQVAQLRSHWLQSLLSKVQKPSRQTEQNPLESTSKQPGERMQRPEKRKEYMLGTDWQSVQVRRVPLGQEQHPVQVPQIKPAAWGHWMHSPSNRVQPGMQESQVFSATHRQLDWQSSQCWSSKKQEAGHTRSEHSPSCRHRHSSTTFIIVSYNNIIHQHSYICLLKHTHTYIETYTHILKHTCIQSQQGNLDISGRQDDFLPVQAVPHPEQSLYRQRLHHQHVLLHFEYSLPQVQQQTHHDAQHPLPLLVQVHVDDQVHQPEWHNVAQEGDQPPQHEHPQVHLQVVTVLVQVVALGAQSVHHCLGQAVTQSELVQVQFPVLHLHHDELEYYKSAWRGGVVLQGQTSSVVDED